MSDVLSSKMEKRHRHISQVKPRRHRTRLFLAKRTRRTRAQQSNYQYPTSLFSSKPHFGSLSISKTSPEQFLTPLKAPSKLRPIPTLAHGLDRVLFSPGVHWVQDPRSRVYNFIPWVQNIPPLDDFAFNRVAEFVPSADDDSLQKLAKQHGKKFTGSTSSLSGMLCHIYFLLADRRKLNISMLSQSFSNESQSFTFGQMLPASVLLRYRDGVYSTNGDPTQPGEPEMNVLSRFGTMLEKFLTMPQLDFRHLTKHYVPLSNEDDALPEHCRYAKTDKYIMRSQLDCRDGRLPGSGVFDIKTRAALPIRLDLWNIKENSGYLIRHLHGRFQSFESEYYDLIRSAFLKYWFQARIGGMDGVFVTYHNTSMIFGFQYVPVSDMEYALFGDNKKGNFIFQACVKLLEDCMEKIVGLFPQTNISCHWDWNKRLEWVDIWAQPADKSKPVAQIRLIIPEIGLIDLLGQLERPEILNGSKPWKIPYLIDIATEPQEEILSELQRSIDRAAVYWTRGGGSASTSPRKPGNDSGSSFIRHLRKLSKQGKVHTERLAKAEAGKPRVVLGQ
ncbi:mitochondrial protein Pet127-domain-containing protein [Abortiporus biennis]|nr:mitochondrial protein Pet127-domain-containing protein [Abortiporus biennis]